ncbi:unnamed protein product [Miscanthus lutarioriparius]|uniref:Uncharacterized protein n=1 Tax=Miscanthus lutarioriparius TaxID=422564 RepID=A0A811RE84_9POAL|nr:unnamed protein product [Miscanthus lutarioriparius]
MGARGRRNLRNKRTSKEATASASASAEGGDHGEDTMKRNSKKDQFPSTKPTAQEEEDAQPPGAGKKEKKKRVVRERLPQGLIDREVGPEFADYAERKAETEKMVAYEQALIDQYLINGYAEDEKEVTDNEGEGDDMAEKDRVN